jgi:hypothetical protein
MAVSITCASNQRGPEFAVGPCYREPEDAVLLARPAYPNRDADGAPVAT